MISLSEITMTAWIVWAVSGVVCGIVSAIAIGGRRTVWIDICVGLVASLCGGAACAMFAGDETVYDVILSTLCGVFLAGVALWIMDEVAVHEPELPDDFE